MSRCLYFLGWLLLLLGITLQAWLKDHDAHWAVVFYGMPKPCLMALAAVLSLWPGLAWRVRFVNVVTALSVLGWWIHASWCLPQTQKNDPNQATISILYWNLCRPYGVDQEMVVMVKKLQPHVAVFVEAWRAREVLEKYESLLPGYQVILMPKGILVLTRVALTESADLSSRFEVQGFGSPFLVAVADVAPHPFLSRRPQLQSVLALVGGRRDGVIVGDFNTPLESALLADYRRNFVEAFEVAGSGFKETWPCGLPLLSIDHIWVAPEWCVVSAEKLWRLTGSDHAALFVTLLRR